MSWAVGDLAVCVDDSVNPRMVRLLGVHRFPIRRGKILRVSRVVADNCPFWGAGVGLFFNDILCIAPSGFAAVRFRKIEPAEPCFIEAMRNLRTPVEA